MIFIGEAGGSRSRKPMGIIICEIILMLFKASSSQWSAQGNCTTNIQEFLQLDPRADQRRLDVKASCVSGFAEDDPLFNRMLSSARS